jgi:ATP-dependent Clp protease ATP-binding subunit ClpC
VFERFTDRAKAAVVHAAQEAAALNHHYMGTEHLLLGILQDDAAAAFGILSGFGVSLDDCRTAVEQIVGRGDGPPTGHLPFTPRAKKVVEISLLESRQLGDRRIGTEHLLLALLREGGGVAAQILAAREVTLSAVERLVREQERDGPDPGFGDNDDPPVA